MSAIRSAVHDYRAFAQEDDPMHRPREILPALTPDEVAQRDEAYFHARRSHINTGENAKVKVHVRCNQPQADGSMCRWDEWLNTRAVTAERDGKRAIARHLDGQHPSQNARAIAARAWVNLADIGG